MKPEIIPLLLLGTLAYALNIPIARQNVSHSPREALPASSFTYEPIKTGYVAFGDSYAAGIGAGSTSGDGCRVGLLSYPNQLNIWVESLQPNIDFQNLPCSGAVVTEVLQGGSKSQIDKWTNPSKADRATLSIGGNDIGFYNVLTSCASYRTRLCWKLRRLHR
jgi:lysophospholipase L1-like esterase